MPLDFEQPIRDIETKINDIEQYMKASQVDLSQELEMLKAKRKSDLLRFIKLNTVAACADCPSNRTSDDTRLYSIYI